MNNSDNALTDTIRTSLSLPASLSPCAMDIVKVLALMAMLLDHINTLYIQPSTLELYALGRMAFPLFLMIWAVNVGKNPEKLQARANRLWLWAIVTQPAFVLAFRTVDPWYALNILFVFASVTQLLALNHVYHRPGLVAGVVLLAVLVYPLSLASYGLQGLILALSLAVLHSTSSYRFRQYAALFSFTALCTLNGLIHLIDKPVDALLYAIFPTLLLPLLAIGLAAKLKPAGNPRFLPARFFYFAYAGHLLLLGFLFPVP
jgi:type-F conjugative transfer system pilin acetylase TraX